MFRARAFSLTARSLAEPVDLRFPSSPRPSPFDIFHFAPDEPLTSAAVKARYYELCKLYHPDLAASKGKGKGKAKAKANGDGDDDSEFKQIVAAYELLRNPTKRTAYLRSGHGWVHAGSPRNANGDAMGEAFSFRRGRPMSASARRPAYPSSAWDWQHSAGWTDPHNPHWRPDRDGFGAGTAGVDASPASGWKGHGAVGRNGTIFLALASLTLFATPLTVWSATPNATASSDSGWIPVIKDRRHHDAAQALERARTEARISSIAKREAIRADPKHEIRFDRRRVREIERARALERARQVESVEKGEYGTGHQHMLAAPPSPPPLPSPPSPSSRRPLPPS